MAELSQPELIFNGGYPDPGSREVKLPDEIPIVGDDFDWQQRDYESFRLFMENELRARFPERKRWTPADIEFVLIEIFAALLDQLSDMADRIAAESYLETARRPESVLNWLEFIGGDPALEHGFGHDQERLIDYWIQYPHEMERDRRSGPQKIQKQERMASLDDYARRLEEHPLVYRAEAWQEWSGAWPTIYVTVSLWNEHDDCRLDTPLEKNSQPQPLCEEIIDFHKRRDLLEPFDKDEQDGLLRPRWKNLCTRDILNIYISRYRMIGQEVILRDAHPVGIDLGFCIQLGCNYYLSEVRREVLRVLGNGPGGFFEPGRLRFGQDLHEGDFYECLMAIDGVTNVEILMFKRTGEETMNKTTSGSIFIGDLEFAICNNDPLRRQDGFIDLILQGGISG